MGKANIDYAKMSERISVAHIGRFIEWIISIQNSAHAQLPEMSG